MGCSDFIFIVFVSTCLKAQSGGLRYEECLSASIGFINPNNVAHLTAELGLDNTSSFMADLDGRLQFSLKI